MPKLPYEWRVDSHGCYTCNNADLALSLVTPRPTSQSIYICAPPIFLALTVSRAANKPNRRAWNAKLPSMSVDNAAGNLHSLHRPEVLVPRLRKTHSIFLRPLLPLNTLTGVLQAHSLPTLWPMRTVQTVTMKQVRAMLLDKMR